MSKALPPRAASGNRRKTEQATKLGKTQLVGPWLREDWRNFKRIEIEALRLEPPDRPMEGPLGFRSASRIPNISAAETALHANAVYRWLANHVPQAVDTAGDTTPFAKFRRVRIVAQHVLFAGALTREKPVRTDKGRIPLLNAIERVERSLNDGSLSLSNLTKEELLENLLAEAKQSVQARQRQPKSHGYPWLRRLALELFEETRIGTARSALLLEVAAVLNLPCDERTAQRYVRDAQEAQSIADK
jgi:hypothetical protein